MARLTRWAAGFALVLGLLLPLALAQPPTDATPLYQARLSCGDILTGRETLACATGPAAAAGAWVQATVEGNELVLHGTYGGLSAPVLQDIAMGVHVHRDAELYHLDTLVRGLSNEGGTEGTLYGRMTLTPEYRSMLQVGRLYLDIHTATFPEGEIHGRLIPVGTDGRAAW